MSTLAHKFVPSVQACGLVSGHNVKFLPQTKEALFRPGVVRLGLPHYSPGHFVRC